MIRINVDNFNTAPYYTIPANNPYVADDGVNVAGSQPTFVHIINGYTTIY